MDSVIEKGEEGLEKKVKEAVKSILKQFDFIKNSKDKLPKEIILKNYEGYEIFKKILEQALYVCEYDIPVVIEENKEGYFIDVGEYMKLVRYD